MRSWQWLLLGLLGVACPAPARPPELQHPADEAGAPADAAAPAAEGGRDLPARDQSPTAGADAGLPVDVEEPGDVAGPAAPPPRPEAAAPVALALPRDAAPLPPDAAPLPPDAALPADAAPPPDL